MNVSPLIFIIFNIFILFMLALDLGVIRRNSHVVTVKEALQWMGLRISLALGFCLFLFFWHGAEASITFLTGYVIELSLSVDNIFVIIMIFSSFAVNPRFQHKILFWGILGAIVMRAIFIVAGVALINKFHWIIYVFGGFLIFSAVKMMLQKEEAEVDPEKNWVIRVSRKFLPIVPADDTGRLVMRSNGKIVFTTLFIVLIFVEVSDLIFALDSIPAIISITRDSFLVYTSNIFAILGLRSLYFALVGMTQQFHHLKYGVSFILGFVGFKMLVSDFLEIPVYVALAVILLALVSTIISSKIWPEKNHIANCYKD